MKSFHYTFAAFLSCIVSVTAAQDPVHDNVVRADLWNELDACGRETRDPEAILATIEPMITIHDQDGTVSPSKIQEKESFLKRIKTNILEKNTLRHELFELAKHAEGDFTDPLLDAQIELHVLRQIWQSNSPLVIQQEGKVAVLEETLPPVPPEKCLAHVWRRIVLTETEGNMGGLDSKDTRFKAGISPLEFRSLRIAALEHRLDEIRQTLRKRRNQEAPRR